MDYHLRLVQQIRAQEVAAAGGSLPVVGLEEFFSGNTDYGSIGCNLMGNPGPQGFFEVLRAVREKAAVQDVLVEINDVTDDPQTWPFSDRVYILTSAKVETVREWLGPLQPDEVTEGWAGDVPPVAPKPKQGFKVYAAWWD